MPKLFYIKILKFLQKIKNLSSQIEKSRNSDETLKKFMVSLKGFPKTLLTYWFLDIYKCPFFFRPTDF